MTWTPPVETDLYYSRLPFREAQSKLGEFRPSAPGVPAACGWHGTSFDAERGSVVIIGTNGILNPETYLGERIQISTQSGLVQTVFAYVHMSAALDVGEDISLPRRMFLALGLPSATALRVLVSICPPA